MSYKGSAIATLTAYASMMVLSYYFGRKYYPIPYNLKKIRMYLFLSIGLSYYPFINLEKIMFGISMLIVFLGIVYFSEKMTSKNLKNEAIKRK